MKNKINFKSLGTVIITLGILTLSQGFMRHKAISPKYALAFSQQDTLIVNPDLVKPIPELGLNAFRQYVGRSYRMPKAAFDANVHGRLEATFIITKEGKLTDIKITKDLGYGTGEEYKRVLINSSRSMKWKPGTLHGEPQNVKFTLPINL